MSSAEFSASGFSIGTGSYYSGRAYSRGASAAVVETSSLPEEGVAPSQEPIMVQPLVTEAIEGDGKPPPKFSFASNDSSLGSHELTAAEARKILVKVREALGSRVPICESDVVLSDEAQELVRSAVIPDLLALDTLAREIELQNRQLSAVSLWQRIGSKLLHGLRQVL